jgi:glycosyltransferase involved in cell wall biosynthesis
MGFELLISGFARRGLSFDVLDLSRAGVAERAGSFDPIRVVNTLGVLGRGFRLMVRAHVLYMTIGASGLGFLRDAMLIWAARLCGCRIVLHLKGGGYRQLYDTQSRALRALMSRTLAQADRIVVLGKLLRLEFDFVPGAERRLVVVPNGLPLGLASDSGATKTLPQPGKPFRMLYLSNLIESKGYQTVLQACRLLKQRFDFEFTCDFCGDFVQTVTENAIRSPHEAEMQFRAQVKEWGLDNIVVHHGLVRGERKAQFLKTAHVFVLPTRYAWEGQPISIIEALAYATPVISTRYRGIPEQVIHSYNGFLIPPDAPEILAKHIAELAANQDLYKALSRQAQQHFQEHFTGAAHLQRLIAVIEGVSESNAEAFSSSNA